jgi:hypothetical protein
MPTFDDAATLLRPLTDRVEGIADHPSRRIGAVLVTEMFA